MAGRGGSTWGWKFTPALDGLFWAQDPQGVTVGRVQRLRSSEVTYPRWLAYPMGSDEPLQRLGEPIKWPTRRDASLGLQMHLEELEEKEKSPS